MVCLKYSHAIVLTKKDLKWCFFGEKEAELQRSGQDWVQRQTARFLQQEPGQD